MRIGIIGINHKSADLQLRELLAKVCERLFNPAHSLHTRFSYVLLSTCNRIEVYFHSEDPSLTHTYLLNALRSEISEEFEHRIYSYFSSDCFFHLARVTAGVDGALIGETEIQGQVKRAYEMALRYKNLAPELHFLFQKCLMIGKNIRTSTLLTKGLPTLEEAILNVGNRILGSLPKRKILFVGLSEINHKIFILFKDLGCRAITFCNRSTDKVIEFSEKERVSVLPWQELKRWSEFDLVIFGTKCPHFLVERQTAFGDIHCRLIIDLSVPRNVDPKIGRQTGITLVNVDQLNRAIDRRRKLKGAEMARIETQVIAKAVQRQTDIFMLKELQRNHHIANAISA